jgi:hypothetical protein
MLLTIHNLFGMMTYAPQQNAHDVFTAKLIRAKAQQWKQRSSRGMDKDAFSIGVQHDAGELTQTVLEALVAEEHAVRYRAADPSHPAFPAVELEKLYTVATVALHVCHTDCRIVFDVHSP